jgi:hypothetical protein
LRRIVVRNRRSKAVHSLRHLRRPRGA